MTRPLCLVCAQLLLATVGARPAWSQTPPAPPPDIVRLNNGGMMRGTIVELVPGATVTITLATGETKQLPMADVAYAGPVGGDSASKPVPTPASTTGASKPFLTVHAPEARLRFQADAPGVTFHLRRGDAISMGTDFVGGRTVTTTYAARSYETICTAPCEASLPAGTHQLALSASGASPVEAKAVTLSGPSEVRGTYVSRRGVRMGGIATMLGGVVAGSALILTAFETRTQCFGEGAYQSCHDSKELKRGQFFAGMGVGVLGSLIGTVMLLQADQATITVAPLPQAAVPGVAATSSSAGSALLPTGLEVAGRF